jgi:hypothetical protein
MSSTSLPRIYTCSDSINMVDFIDINFSVLSLTKEPAINVSANVDVNIFISNKTKTTARINFSQKFVGTVYYTVIGFK